MEEIFSYNSFIKEKIYEKLVKYCAYQDRCHSDVLKKMSELKTNDKIADEILVKLIEEGYLNEERFVRSFIRGKYRINKWGKKKIVSELRFKGIAANLINICLNEIDEEEYYEILKQLMNAKFLKLGKLKSFEIKNKLKSYAYSRGFELEIAENIISAFIE
jgi:regulatory protein